MKPRWWWKLAKNDIFTNLDLGYSDSGTQQKIGVDSGMDFFDDLETWIENIHCIHAGTCCSSNVDD